MSKAVQMVIEFLKYIWDIAESHILPFQVIRTYEMGVRLTLGKNPKIVGPGLRLKWPLIQEVFVTNVVTNTLSPKAVHVTTMDGKTITVQPAIEYEIEDVQKWLLECDDAVSNLYDLVRGYVADYLTDINWEEAVKKETRTAIKKKLNDKVRGQMGCNIKLLIFTEICQNKVILTSFN